MENLILKNKFKKALTKELPGIQSHLKLAPLERIDGIRRPETPKDAKHSAVLIVLFNENRETKIVFILRSVYDGVHSGQISFPGGKKETRDKDLMKTAIRETQEEIGIEVSTVDILGKLSHLYIPNSNFIVEPYVAYIENLNKIIPDSTEVQQVYKISLKDLLDDNVVQLKEVLLLNKNFISAPCFCINNIKIWGATAMILNELLDIIKTNHLTEILP